MGNDKSKHKYTPGLSQDQKDCIYSLLESGTSNKPVQITAELLQNIWKDTLSDGLLHIFLNFLFKSSKSISRDELEMFYFHMVEAGIEERAKILVQLLGIDNTIPPKNFQTYVSDLVHSYMIILRQKSPAAYSSWASGDLTQKSDIMTVSQFFVRDINYVDGKLQTEELENWLRRSSFVKELSESVLKVVFNMEITELRPTLPKATKYSTLLRIPTVLTLSHFVRESSDDWRLLYSSSDEAHSWNVLQTRIFGQGPTIVLVQDTAGPLFGGYASQSWKLAPTFYGDQNSFLFRLRPELRICVPTGYNDNYQYLNTGAATLPNGLGMGGQLNYFGFFLSSQFGPGSVSKTCTTYRDYIPLASQSEFFFSKVEVWGIGEPDVQEEGVRQFNAAGGLIMQRDPGAAAILELAGKSGYSKTHVNLEEMQEAEGMSRCQYLLGQDRITTGTISKSSPYLFSLRSVPYFISWATIISNKFELVSVCKEIEN